MELKTGQASLKETWQVYLLCPAYLGLTELEETGEGLGFLWHPEVLRMKHYAQVVLKPCQVWAQLSTISTWLGEACL